MFATPWYEENVVLTPGDMGGRMNNKLKPEEMFVVIPARWANNLVKLLGGSVISMPWEEEAMATIAKTPKFVRKFAVGNVEDFAEEKAFPVVTAACRKGTGGQRRHGQVAGHAEKALRRTMPMRLPPPGTRMSCRPGWRNW